MLKSQALQNPAGGIAVLSASGPGGRWKLSSHLFGCRSFLISCSMKADFLTCRRKLKCTLPLFVRYSLQICNINDLLCNSNPDNIGANFEKGIADEP